MRDNIEGDRSKHDAEITHYPGRGEFLGGDTRSEGQRAYRGVIKAYEVAHPDSHYTRPSLPDIGQPEALRLVKLLTGSYVDLIGLRIWLFGPDRALRF